jgi:hypothetical protein
VTLVENMLSFKELMLRPKYGKFELVIMPTHFMMLVVLPFVLLISVVSIIMLT